MRQFIIFIALFIAGSTYCIAQNDVENDFEKFKRQREQEYKDFAKEQKKKQDEQSDELLNFLKMSKEEYALYEKRAMEEYARYEKRAKEEYQNYVNSIKKIWGNNNVADNTKEEWVEYGKDNRSRTIVDFENGDIVVEVAINQDKDNKKEIDKELEIAVENLLKSKGKTCPYESTVDVSKNLTKKPVLDNLVDYSEYSKNGAKINENNKKELAKTIVKQSTPQKQTIVGGDGEKRVVAKIEMKMVPNRLSKNAALYKDMVQSNSNRFNIEQPLIYAIMEQESNFNPSATSWVPAYGLMQLVPKYGGYDAYLYVYKRGWVPTKSYLYQADKNIELGTAYLKILMNQFSKVTDAECRRLCVIASYNTGAGNVSRAFTGKTNVNSAIKIINTMSYSQLYNHLVRNLNSSEARNYVKKVSERRDKYMR